MKQLISVLVITIGISFPGLAQKIGHDITIEVKGIVDETAYLCYHLDSKTYVADTVPVINETVRFQSDEELEPGMYFLYTKGGIFYEFLVKDQFFTITADKKDMANTAEVRGSKEIELFLGLQRQMAKFQQETRTLQESLAKPDADSTKILENITRINRENRELGMKLAQENKGTLFSQVLALMDRPTDITAPDSLDEKAAQLYKYYEYKSQFWSGVDFTEPGIIRTPLYLPKMKEYFEKVVPTHPDSLATALDEFLSQDMDSTVFQYSLVTMVNLYANSKTMGMDAVYVHLVDNYYAKGKAPWTDETTLNRMLQTSNRLRTLLIGAKAPDFSIPDINGKLVSPETIPEDYLILFIYDSGCGHCKKAAPKMVSTYEKLKETMSVDLVTVNLSENEEEWKGFIDTYGLSGTNLGDLTGTSNIGYYYYVTSTPQVYILNKDREIIAKKLAAEQILDFLPNYHKAFNQ
ncbi:MAG: redoxin domain-containing protein [bacterium]|nr:redoxin domain-containing protein [bacterium]